MNCSYGILEVFYLAFENQDESKFGSKKHNNKYNAQLLVGNSLSIATMIAAMEQIHIVFIIEYVIWFINFLIWLLRFKRCQTVDAVSGVFPKEENTRKGDQFAAIAHTQM
ncbi:unnamed protein product [Camellia sinensis]